MAGRIPQHFIDDLLARVNILDVVESRVKIKRSGKNYAGLCPFHQEKSPSFTVAPDKQLYYCFGCGAGGNAIGFIMEYERLSFPEAIEELAKLAGVEVPREESHNSDNQQEERLKQQYQLLERANLFFQQQLRTHSDRQRAVAYLKGRGLSGQIASRFQIGFAPPGWDNLVKDSSDLSEAAQKLEQVGLVIHNEERERYYDRFRDRIMFPIRDMRGRVIAFGGRVLTDEKPKYLNSPETDTFHKGRELYGLYEARQHTRSLTRLLIVEGYMDVVGLAQHGITWSVATLGTATSGQHLSRLFKLVPELVFCFDGDQAGRTAAARALEVALPIIKDGMEVRFLFLPEGEDPDTLIRQEGQAGFEARVNEALPLSEFFFRLYAEDADLSSMDGRARFATHALPKIQSMQPSLLREMMIERICEITGLSHDQLNSVINLHQSTQNTSPPQPSEPSSPPPAPPVRYQQIKPTTNSDGNRRSLVNSAISILLHYPQLAIQAADPNMLEKLDEPNAALLAALIRYFNSAPNLSLGTLLVDWQQSAELSSSLVTLNEISHLDPVVGDINPAQLLNDAFQRLLQRADEGKLDLLLKKSRQSPLTQDEKQQLQHLLMARHQK
ncbi:DNA primase [Nitrincola sp. MINF-07-Sa-05]|uniref:DNA primase n=1 Tax=Nitrincola salilacus TaxID=3400273 RepID=UPI0039181620